MNPKIAKDSWLLAIFVVLMTSNVNAAPRNQNTETDQKLDVKVAQLLAQKKQTELAYQRLLEVSEQKARNKKIADLAKAAKPQLVKASFKSSSKTPLSKYNQRLHVTATAYTSHVDQTDSTPNIAAWGDRLKPGMKVIAVSRDLLKVYGLKHKQKVRIKGLEGEYLVLDKMNKRWRKKIDIYMGMNKKKAFRWGRRKVEIYWNS